MTFKSGSFDPRTGVLHIETHSGSSANVRTGVLGGSDNLMWQYEKKENEYLIPFFGTLLLFLTIVGAWIYKITQKPNGEKGIGDLKKAISKQELRFVSGFALSLYIVSAHIIFAIPGFNGVTVAMVTFFAFLADIQLSESKLYNHLWMNFCNVLILLSVYGYTALYCDMFDIRKDNGKFDMANGVFGLLLGLVFAVALFVRFAFPYAKDSPADNVINIDLLFQGIVLCISLFFFFEALAVAMCIRFLYVSSFLFLYGAFLLSAIRLFMKTGTYDAKFIFNIFWLIFVGGAITMTLVHLTGAPRAFERESSEFIKEMDAVEFKITMLFLWGFVIISPVVSLYVSMEDIRSKLPNMFGKRRQNNQPFDDVMQKA